MDLYAGTPYWMVKNRLWGYYRPLRKDLRTTAAVIGAGITGALVAHYSLNIFSEIPFYRLSLYISNLQMFSFNLNTHEISRF